MMRLHFDITYFQEQGGCSVMRKILILGVATAAAQISRTKILRIHHCMCQKVVVCRLDVFSRKTPIHMYDRSRSLKCQIEYVHSLEKFDFRVPKVS